MLYIRKNTNNELIVTVSNFATLSNPYYLFVFVNDVTYEEVKFICSNTSTHTERYDKFLITETSGTQIPTSGTIEFLPLGSWTYKIYEQTSSTNLVVANTTSLLETGQAKVLGSNETYSTYTGQDITYKVHERS